MTQTIFLAIAVAGLVFVSVQFVVQIVVAIVKKQSANYTSMLYIVSFLSALVVVLARG